MTRETKIGLLVGLAFIIVIGILLSDHLTSSTEPPQASLGMAGNGIRQAVGNPGAITASPVTVVPTSVAPQQTVATQAELTTPAPAVQIVKVGGPVMPASQQPTRMMPAETAASTPAFTPIAANDQPVITPVSNPPVTTDSDLSKVAQANGEPLVSADDTKLAAGAAQEYVAQPGDSLSKIAAKFLGSGNKTNRNLIVKANPSLQANENMIIAGKTYKIPAANSKPATPVAAVPVTAAPVAAIDDTTAKTASARVEKSAKPDDAGYVYMVQPGDNLTRIARDQVGDVGAVAAIQELNPDTLKGANHDVVIAGTKLRLPGKPMARAE